MEIDALKQRLQETLGTGEVLNIIYHGGSEPGTARQVLPKRLDGDILRALCLTANRVKGFHLSKVELAETDQQTYTGTKPREEEPPEPESLEAGMAPYLAELESLGWIIAWRTNQIGLFECFKNGKRKAMPTLYLLFDETVQRKPWRIPGQFFKYFVRAVEVFMDEARKHAPNKKV